MKRSCRKKQRIRSVKRGFKQLKFELSKNFLGKGNTELMKSLIIE